ncbi:M56 family metallopeptidase [Candidatus Palauibacter sp.]|uniref:M56 family metallopeptidase n=1 Tax=Candidatus Palauibacter sp. TaxID=3101350 RepID=UPI003B017339
MTDLALQIAGSKLAISIVLGAAVWLLALYNQRPRACHALCLTLLTALLIPPLIGLPVLNPAVPAPEPAAAVAFNAVQTVGLIEAAGASGLAQYGGFGLVLAWILGAVAIVGWTVARARAFHSSLKRASRGASPDVQRMAEEIARTLGLESVPTIEMTGAVVSPMVYWSGGTVRVLIPSALLEGMEQSQLRWILAHELAHVRRRDHLVRWIEWLACTVFWWNPIAWWARRRLRAAGEICCDALVVHAFGCAPRDYARSLVRALDLVRTEQASCPPAFASAAHNGRRTRQLEGRLRMIITNGPAGTPSPALRTVLRGGLVVLLAFGLVYCSERTSPTGVEMPGGGAPILNLTTADLETVELPPAEGLVPLAAAGEPPDGIRMTGQTYGELMASLDGLQTFHYGQSEEPAARLGALSCYGCHADDPQVEGRTLPLRFRAMVQSTADGGWSIKWELAANPHEDSGSTGPGASPAVTFLSSQWLPAGTIERVVVDRPPPPRR